MKDETTAFVLAATSGNRARADALLAARPEVARDPWARLALGRGWDGDPNEPGGPRGWAPLLYVCHSVYASAALARELLARGADPNATFEQRVRRDVGALRRCGRRPRPRADPRAARGGRRTPTTASRSTTRPRRATRPACACCSSTARRRAARTRSRTRSTTTGWSTFGCCSTRAPIPRGPLVAHAVRRGRGPELVRLLVERGAELDRPGGETWRGDVPLRTPYQHAVLRNRTDRRTRWPSSAPRPTVGRATSPSPPSHGGSRRSCRASSIRTRRRS